MSLEKKSRIKVNFRFILGILLITLLALTFSEETLGAISNPITEVVGGSSLFGTRTLEYIVIFFISLILAFLFGVTKPLADGDKKKYKLLFLTLKNKLTNRTIKFPSLQEALVLLFAILALSRLSSFLIVCFVEKSFPISKNTFALATVGLLVVIVILFLLTTRVFRHAKESHGWVGTIASTLPVLTTVILYLSLTYTYEKVSSSESSSHLSVLTFIFVILICIFVFMAKKMSTQSLNYAGILSGIYLLIARVPGPVENLDYFESFPKLNVFAYRKWGYLPWNDLQLNHGIYHDFLRPAFGTLLFDDSIWAMQAGIGAILFPLEVILVLYLTGKILKAKTFTIYFFLVIIAFARTIPSEGQNSWLFIFSLPRAIPLLLCTLALKHLLEEFRLKNFIFLAITLTISTIWASENLIIWFSVSVTLLYAMISSKRTKASALSAVGLSAFLAPILLIWIFLKNLGLVEGFLGDYEGLSSNILQGALNFNFKAGVPYSFFTLGLPLCFLILSYRYAERLRYGLTNSELVLIPTLATGVYYFVKFLAWPDLHIQQAVNALHIFWFFLAIQLIKSIQPTSNALSFGKFGSLALIAAMLISSSYPTRNLVPKMLGSQNEIFGSVSPVLKKNLDTYSGLREEIMKITGSTDPLVLDFTNAPVFVHLYSNLKFVPDLSFSSFYVSNVQQKHALEQIKSAKPEAIIFHGPVGLSNGVFPGDIFQRNYVIANEVLSQFKRVTRIGDYTILTRGSANLSEANFDELMPQKYRSCDWFNSLNFVPNLDARSTRGELKVVSLKNLSSLGEQIADIRGFSVTVATPGAYKISVLSKTEEKTLATVSFNVINQKAEGVYVPVDVCPGWRLNSDPVGELKISGVNSKIREILLD